MLIRLCKQLSKKSNYRCDKDEAVLFWCTESASLIIRLEPDFLVYGGNFHFCSLQRMPVSFPVDPLNSVVRICIGIFNKEAIQIGLVAGVKPPTSTTIMNAVPMNPNIVVLVLSAEHHVIVVGKAVP